MNNVPISALPGQVLQPEGVFPLNGEELSNYNLNASNTNNSIIASANLSNVNINNSINSNLAFQTSLGSSHRGLEPVLPDFKVWKHTPKDDALMRSHLQKGYFEASSVSNESHSGRQIITQLLHRSSSFNTHLNNGTGPGNENVEMIMKSKLNNLSEVMVKSILRRREINKIKTNSTYKPPPRVTLTEHKREMWLKNLADPNIPLKQLSRAIPHGLRNRVLLEQCVNHRVPISRAIWFIRCVSTNEQRQLKRKQQSAATSQMMTVNKWIHEWTEQVTLFIEQVIQGCFNPANKDTWRFKLNYFIELSSNLYLEELMSRETFLSWIANYSGRLIKKDSVDLLDYKAISIHYLFIKLFWFKIINIDYLSKELSENMLLTVSKLQDIPKQGKGEALVNKLISNFQMLIRYMFYHNSDTFIIPGSWHQLKIALKKIIDMSNLQVSEQYKLITYRNESLMIDETNNNGSNSGSRVGYNKALTMIHKLDNFTGNLKEVTNMIFDDSNNGDNIDETNDWRKILKLILKWAVTIFREKEKDYQRICYIRSILTIRLLQLSQLKNKKYKQMKLELEMEVIEFVYEMTELLNYNMSEKCEGGGSSYSLSQFLMLINELYSLDLFVISSYLRRLIASGVIYLQEADKSCYIHLLILNSLPTLRDSNSKNILKRLSDSTGIPLVDNNYGNLKEQMVNLLDTIFQQTSEFEIYEFVDIYQPSDSIVEALEVGRNAEIGSWFLNQFQSYLQQYGASLKLDSQSFLILYKLFNGALHKLPQFLQMLVNFLNTSPVHVDIDQETMGLLLTITSLNDSMLAGCTLETPRNSHHQQPSPLPLPHESLQSPLSSQQQASPAAPTPTAPTPTSTTAASSAQNQNSSSNLFYEIYSIIANWSDTNKYNITSILRTVRFDRTLLPSDVKIELEDNRGIIKPDQSDLSIDDLNQLGIISFERLANAAEYLHHLNQTINQYWNLIKGFNSDSHPLIIKLLKVLQNWKPDDFQNVLVLNLKKFVMPTLSLEYEMSLKFVLKLITKNFIDLQTAVKIFDNNSSKDEFSTNSSEKLIWDLLFNAQIEKDLEDYELIVLRTEKKKYRLENPTEYFRFLSIIFKKSATTPMMTKGSSSSNDVDMVNVGVGVDDVVSVDVMNSLHDLSNVSVAQTPPSTFNNGSAVVVVGGGNDVDDSRQMMMHKRENKANNKLNDVVVSSIWHLTSSNMDLFVDLFYDKDVNKSDVKDLFMLMLDVKDRGLNGGVFMELIRKLNYFNLQISQLLFKILFEEEVQDIEDDYESSGRISDIIVGILGQLHEREDEFYLIGELFEFIDNKLKLKILYCCEEIYFGSETFPKLTINGENLTKFLIDIISSCSRLKDYNSTILPLSDSLVFSLNLSLEKLMYFCSSLEHNRNKQGQIKDLETSIILLSRIILIHKNFLVELILKRSVNLQRDVFLINLTKLFNHRVMDKNYKLKNLLYDILISIKILISESLSKQQLQQLQQQPSSSHSINNPAGFITSLSLNKGTPTSTSFLSPVNSPMPPPQSAAYPSMLERTSSNAYGVAYTTTAVPAGSVRTGGAGGLMNVNPPNYNNKLKFLLNGKQFEHFRDALIESDKRYYLVDGSSNSVSGYDYLVKFNLKSFELIEDSSPSTGLNDSCVSLQLFDSCIEKKNPR